MIYHRGHFKPTAAQRKAMREQADESFTAVVSDDFGAVPEFPGYIVDRRTITALACVCVTPHTDTWVGDHDESDGEDGPEARRSIFWVVDAPVGHRLHLQVGERSAEMEAGDWVVFDDRILHSVGSTRKWRGCAYQIRPGRP